VHIANVVEFRRANSRVNRHYVATLSVCTAEILRLLDLEGALPVFTVHRHHEVLKVVQSVHIAWHVLLCKLLAELTL